MEDLLDLLEARKGHFRLASGHHGDLWLDLDRLFLRPHRLRRFAVQLADRFSSHDVAALCGPMVGGALLAQMVAAELEAEFYYAERIVPPGGGGGGRNALHSVEYRIPNGVRDRVEGKNFLIVVDVINAGSAVRGTIADLRSCGANPVSIGALLILGSSASNFLAEQKVPWESIAYIPGGLWVPAKCPLCASGTPLEDVSTG